jgi:site-specific recombinase XerD
MRTHDSGHSLTLAHAFEQFLEVSSFAQRTHESYAQDLAPLLAEAGQQPVTTLTTDVLQAFLARQEPLAPATYNRRLAALRSFTRWLREQGWIAEALLDGMERKPEGKRAARALDAQKVESVLRKIEDPRDRALFWLIYDGGLRCQEALSIYIDDISWPDRSIRLHGKGDRPREMFFSRAVGTLLDKYLATRGNPTSEPLFVTHRKARLPRRADLDADGYARFSYRQADLMMPLASERLLAVWALALLFHILLDLLGSHGLLDASQHLFGFIQP